MSVSILNTDAQISAKTLQTSEGDQTITGLKTFDRDPSAPFAVSASSAVVTNLDADSVDGAHYAVGSWTPTITGSGGQSGQVYSIQVGRYIKVGNLVTAWGRVKLSTLGTITTDVQISGLPFTADNVANLYGDCHINYWANMTASYVYLSGQVVANTTVVTLIGAESAATGVGALTQAKLSNTTDLIFCVKYQASA